MGIILWPLALLIFLFWSLAAWIIFGLSEWTASFVAAALGDILTAELGPWAAWLMNSLGAIIKFGVVAVWAIVSLGILGAPLWLRRQRHAGKIPDAYTTGYPIRSRPRDTRMSDERFADDGFDEEPRRRGNDNRSWRDREAWQQRAQESYGEIAFLRDALGAKMGEYRRKKRKKREDDDDDD
ncbi:MAG: hypothetical protein SH859_00605 [Hyphomicrobium aestuarii]|nr:hypothetical protein [Hyphomicrobium aestuarii]